MIHIKSYRIFESIDLELGKELKKYHIRNYSINEDGSVDCNQSVDLCSKKLNQIPFKFNKINGHFIVDINQLTSLKNCPKYINKWFDCSSNELASLEYGPEYIGGSYCCMNNELKTLKGCVEEVNANFNCYNNRLTSLEFCPMEVSGYFNCSNNRLEFLDRSPLIKGKLYCEGMFKTEPEFSGSCQELIWR